LGGERQMEQDSLEDLPLYPGDTDQEAAPESGTQDEESQDDGEEQVDTSGMSRSQKRRRRRR